MLFTIRKAVFACICLSNYYASAQLIRLPIIQQQNNHGILKRDSIPAIPLFNANAREYLIELGIGTPPQLFNVTLDTGRYIHNKLDDSSLFTMN